MSSVLTANLTVSFQSNETASTRILLSQQTNFFDGTGSLLLHCYSSTACKYACSIGKVDGGEFLEQTVYEGIKFSNSSSAQLKYPNAFNVVINADECIFMRKVLNNGHTSLEPDAGVSIVYDSETDALVVSDGEPVYGFCSVSYRVLYQVVRYKPNIINYLGYGGANVELGTVFAYNDFEVQTVDMTLNMDTAPTFVEYARVTSKIVLDSKGVWEFPPNWKSTYNSNREKIGEQRQDYTEDGKFPQFSSLYSVDASNNFVDERVHLIVEVNALSTVQYKDFNNGGAGYWAWESPYYGYNFYQPDYEIRFNEPPGGYKASNSNDFYQRLIPGHGGWREAFLNVDKNAVVSKIQQAYPGASAYSRNR